jgi:prevent-host-death family protein
VDLARVPNHLSDGRLITGNALRAVAEASIRDLRNRGGDLVDRVAGGEHIVVTRDGEPVAELRPLSRRRLAASAVPWPSSRSGHS